VGFAASRCTGSQDRERVGLLRLNADDLKPADLDARLQRYGLGEAECTRPLRDEFDPHPQVRSGLRA
jgi:hypothetical protein